jgi:tRNA dimethylallyltransferase
LRTLYEEEGLEGLLERLKEGDPEHYRKMDRNNPRRVIRALEVLWATGYPLSSFRGKKKASRPFTPIKIGLWMERGELHRRIEERVGRMLEEGLIEEVRKLLPYRDHRTLRTVGYQELFPYLDGELDLKSARERIERNTRRYAKRQMTWFRRDPDIEWFGPDEEERIVRTIEERTGIKARSDRAFSGI